jgi:hypothetical protein
MNRWITRLAFLVLLSVALAHSAYASTAEVELIVGSDMMFITDNGTGDTNLTGGEIAYSGTFDGWTINFVAADSSSPSVSAAPLSLSTEVVGPGSGTLEILFSDTGFSTATSGFDTTYSVGLLNGGAGSATESAYIGAGIFDEGTLIGTVGPFTGVTAGSAGGGPAGVPDYSLTLEQTLTDTSGDPTIESNGGIEPAPELPALLLFGTGLLAIGGIVRRKTTS